jgi:putative redox protein
VFASRRSKTFQRHSCGVYLEGEIKEDKAAKTLTFFQYCSVSKTLEPTATIHYKVVLNGVELERFKIKLIV